MNAALVDGDRFVVYRVSEGVLYRSKVYSITKELPDIMGISSVRGHACGSYDSPELMYQAMLGEAPPGFATHTAKQSRPIEKVVVLRPGDQVPFKESELEPGEEVFLQATAPHASGTPKRTLTRAQTELIETEEMENTCDLDCMALSFLQNQIFNTMQPTSMVSRWCRECCRTVGPSHHSARPLTLSEAPLLLTQPWSPQPTQS